MSRLWRGVIPVLLLLLAGCGGGPDEETLRSLVTERVQQVNGHAVVDVISFRRLNDTLHDDNSYSAEVEYELRFKVALSEAAEALKAETGSIFSAGVRAANLGMRYGDFRNGDTLVQQERVRLVQSDEGWQIDEAPAER